MPIAVRSRGIEAPAALQLARASGLGGPRGCPPTGRTGSGQLGAACMLRFADLKIIAFTANRLRF